MKPKSLTALLPLFLLAILALSASVNAQDDKPCVAPDVCVTPPAVKQATRPRVVPKKKPVVRTPPRPVVNNYYTTTTSTNCCDERIAALKLEIDAIKNKPAAERYPGDHEKLLGLEGEMKGLTTRVGNLEKRADNTEERVGTLEKECKVLRMTDAKGKTRSYDSCTNQEIKSGGMSTTTKVVIGTGVVLGGTTFVLCVLMHKCGKVGKPPIVTTLPPGPRISLLKPTNNPFYGFDGNTIFGRPRFALT